MYELPPELVIIVSSIAGGIVTKYYGHTEGAIAVGTVLLITQFQYGIKPRLESKSIKSAKFDLLIVIELTLDDPTMRSYSALLGSVAMAAFYAATPAASLWSRFFLYYVWGFLLMMSSWEFAVVGGFMSGLVYLVSAWINMGH